MWQSYNVILALNFFFFFYFKGESFCVTFSSFDFGAVNSLREKDLGWRKKKEEEEGINPKRQKNHDE